MTLLELYEKLCTGEIKLKTACGDITWGLCGAIHDHTDYSWYEFYETVFNIKDFLPNRGVMTRERETFLLLFAAYKGEL